MFHLELPQRPEFKSAHVFFTTTPDGVLSDSHASGTKYPVTSPAEIFPEPNIGWMPKYQAENTYKQKI